MDNQNDLRFLSVKLYPYFSDVVVGSEKVVKYRRYFYKCMDNCLSQRDIRFISSGSRAEGLDLPGSDLDLMCLTDTYVVDEKQGNTQGKRLILDTDNALPGFALIRITDDSFPVANINDVTQTVDGLILNNNFFKQSILEKLNGDCVCFGTTKTLNIDFKTLCKIHGPAVSTALNGIQEVDFVRCLPCREWPSIAKRWLLRNRCFQWPSSDLMTEAIHEGVLLVPVGSKSPSSEENNSEWRFSFSLTEKLLVHSFNHTQLLCYALLKIFLKEIIDKVNIFEKLLCSYYMKTVIFWVLEEVDQSFWVPENLLHCFTLCLKRLHYFILCNCIPNYFITQHNMIEGRFSEKVREQLEIFIGKCLKGNIWNKLLSLDLLSDFRRRNCYTIISKTVHCISEFDKTMISLKIPDLIQFIDDISFRSMSFFAYRIQNQICPTFVKNIFAIALLDFCKRKATLIKIRAINSQHNSNKHYYSQYKQCLFNLLLNVNGDAVSGWLLVAAFYYTCQEYCKMNAIIQLSEEILSRDLYTLSHWVDVTAFKQTTFEKDLVPSRQFLKRLRHSLIRFVCVEKNEHNDDSFIFHEDLCGSGTHFVIGTPIVFIRYLKFLYCHKQKNPEEINRALLLFQETVEKSPQLDCCSIIANCSFSFCALFLTGGYEMKLIETCEKVFSAAKHLDSLGIFSVLQAEFEVECKRYLNG